MKLPEKIETMTETNEGYMHSKGIEELIADLLEGFNQLIDYLEATKQGADK